MRHLLLFLLLAGCAEPEPTGPPAIALARDVLDVGEVSAGVERRLSVPWRRTGAGSLRVLAVETDCGCALAEGPRGPQPAGVGGKIVVRILPRARAGPFTHRLIVYTDQRPPRDRTVCRLRGWSRTPVEIAPAALDLGLRSPGVRLRRDVEVRLHPAFATPALTPRLEGLEGSVRLLPPVRLDLPGRLLRVDVLTPQPDGRFAGRVLLEQRDRVVGSLPITGWVQRDP
jgi:hypothetical protein